MKVLLKRFHLNAHTIGVHPQTQKLKPRTNQMEPHESAAVEVSIESSHHTVSFIQKRRSYYPLMVDRWYNKLKGQGWGGGGGSYKQIRIGGLLFAEYVLLASQSLYPIIVYSVANYSHFWANM